MEDIVAVELTLESGERRYVMTWGRIQARQDPEPLAALVLRHASAWGLSDAVGASVCLQLREARDAPYFSEALISFASQPIPLGPGYNEWLADKASRMKDGRELYYLGTPETD